MVSFVNKYFSQDFNGRGARKESEARLAHEMLQAFYRNERKTIEGLAAKGAPFTEEMLAVAVSRRNHVLTEMCLDANVRPSADLLKFSMMVKDDALFSMLAKKTGELSEDMKDAAARLGFGIGKSGIAPALARRADINPALLSTP